jgi:hypothetical protein
LTALTAIIERGDLLAVAGLLTGVSCGVAAVGHRVIPASR